MQSHVLTLHNKIYFNFKFIPFDSGFRHHERPDLESFLYPSVTVKPFNCRLVYLETILPLT